MEKLKNNARDFPEARAYIFSPPDGEFERLNSQFANSNRVNTKLNFL